MKILYKGLFAFSVFALFHGSAAAISLGTNITISDENYNNSGTVPGPSTWYGNHEDNETETNPSTINRQVWDLEGMFLNGTKLTLVGGFDFKNGVSAAGTLIHGGDLFIDINGDAQFGQAANGGTGTTSYGVPQPINVANIFGYDFVLDIGAFSGAPGSVADASVAFNLVQLSDSSIVTRGMDVASSNPWNYVSGGTVLGSGTGSYGLLSAEDAATYGLLGDSSPNDTHYFMTFDLADVPGIWNESTFHYTMECGNDNLMARGAAVPDGASTVLLLSLSMLGLVSLRKVVCA